MVFDKGVELFYNEQFFNLGCKVPDHLVREGVYHPEFQHRRLRECLFHIEIGDA